MIPPRLPEETPRAYASFGAYCRLGPDRSLAKVKEKSGKKGVKSTLEKWSTEYDWQERVAEYDATIAKAAHAAEEKALKDEAAYFAQEIISHKRQALSDSAELRRAGLVMLKRLIRRGKATLGDVCRALQAADSIKRQNLGMATEKIEHTGPDNMPLAIQQPAPVVIVLEQNDRDTITN